MYASPGELKRQHRESNKQHLTVLEKNGSDLGSAHTTCHQFELHDDTSVGILRSLLLASGFHVLKVHKVAEETPFNYCWKLEAELKVVPMLPSLHAMTDYCVDLARMAEGEYKGWYAEAVPPQK